MLRRSRYLKQREEIIAVRRVKDNTQYGYEVIYDTLKAIVTRRTYQSEGPDFRKGTNVSEEQFAVNVEGRLVDENDCARIVPGDQIVFGRPPLSQSDALENWILRGEGNCVNIKSVSVGVYLTRINCEEL